MLRMVAVTLVVVAGVLGVLALGATQPREVVIGVLYPLSGPPRRPAWTRGWRPSSPRRS